MTRWTILVVCCLVVLFGCSRDDAVVQTKPDRLVVGEGFPPGPGEGVYFNFSVRPSDDPRPILEQILDAGIDLQVGWQPRYITPCAVAGATEALVVQIDGPAPGIEELGFVADPEPWLPNCGISDFWEYRPVD